MRSPAPEFAIAWPIVRHGSVLPPQVGESTPRTATFNVAAEAAPAVRPTTIIAMGRLRITPLSSAATGRSA
jgi:hypothetical protein